MSIKAREKVREWITRNRREAWMRALAANPHARLIDAPKPVSDRDIDFVLANAEELRRDAAELAGTHPAAADNLPWLTEIVWLMGADVGAA